MADITVTITAEPSGSVVARGGDSLAKTLLTHAGFSFTNGWHGPRHRLPTSLPHHEQAAIASHAAQMLTAARYTVDLDPTLDSAPPPTASAPPVVGDHLLHLTDQIRSTSSGGELAEAVGQLLDPEHGALERLREALEATAEQITDLDNDAYTLADRFAIASEFVGAAEGELVGVARDLQQISTPEPYHPTEQVPCRAQPAAHEAALAKSPAAVQAGSSRGRPSTAANAPSPVSPSNSSNPRVR